MDIIITCPDTQGEGIEALCNFYTNESGLLYFRVSGLPKNCSEGDKCYICSNGKIIGYHLITSMGHVSQEETSTLSHGNWSEGNYIIRNASTWNELEDKIDMKGFQGFRYFK